MLNTYHLKYGIKDIESMSDEAPPHNDFTFKNLMDCMHASGISSPTQSSNSKAHNSALCESDSNNDGDMCRHEDFYCNSYYYLPPSLLSSLLLLLTRTSSKRIKS